MTDMRTRKIDDIPLDFSGESALPENDGLPEYEAPVPAGKPQDEKYFRKINRLEQGHPAALRYFMNWSPTLFELFYPADAELLSKIDPTALAKKADTHLRHLEALSDLADQAGNTKASEAITTLDASRVLEKRSSLAESLAQWGNPDGLKKMSEFAATRPDLVEVLVYYKSIDSKDINDAPALKALQDVDTSFYAQSQPDPQTALQTLGSLAAAGNTGAVAFFQNPRAWVFQDGQTIESFFIACYPLPDKILREFDLNRLPQTLVTSELPENYLLNSPDQGTLAILLNLAASGNVQAQKLLVSLDLSRPADVLCLELKRQMDSPNQDQADGSIELYVGLTLLERAADLGNASAQKKLEEISAMFDDTQTPPESPM